MKRSAWLWSGVHFLVAGIVFVVAPASFAEDGWIAAPFTPFQIGVAAGHSQLFREDVPVYGLRLSAVYGRAVEVKGLDLGPVNEAESLAGVSVGALNITQGDAPGAVYFGVGNINMQDLGGVQIGAVNDVAGAAKGVQLGVVSQSTSLKGLQLGAGNRVGGPFTGVQLGALNGAESGEGLQLGILNYSKSMRGLQLGLLNFNENGFLPFFPFFNFGL